jgi:hypothetical protein
LHKAHNLGYPIEMGGESKERDVFCGKFSPASRAKQRLIKAGIDPSLARKRRRVCMASKKSIGLAR